ncbi:MAG TPA: AraC family transcriptional regulator [Rhodobacteraceae bacterium]|jgi:AraC-like DNA-binding protein|nr:AraC family transcriptional regulator [Paracoccaceae bacterium]
MTKIEHKLPEVRMTPIPRLAKGGRWRVEAMRSYSSNLLLWFTSGQGRITVAGITRGYGAHNAVFIPSGVMHGFEASTKVFGTAIFVPKVLGLPFPDMPQHLRIRDAAPQSEITGILSNLDRELEGNLPERIRAAHHYTGLLAVWLKRQTLLHLQDSKAPDAAQRLTTQFTELVEQDYHSGKNVAQYAKALGVTPTHLSRVCNQACGRPASVLLHDRVIFEARRLLRETRTPIHQVATELGFTSPAYFSRAFQQHTGQTPSAFRRSS